MSPFEFMHASLPGAPPPTRPTVILRAVLLLACALRGGRLPAQNATLDWSCVAGGGGSGAAGPYSLAGTIGQSQASETALAGPYHLTGGFWSPSAAFLPNSSQSNLWINVAGGSWTSPGNWVNGIVANGGPGAADFSQLPLTTNATVTLDGPRTIGGLVFADQNGASNWYLGTGSGDPLTLGGSAPAITVLNESATLGVNLAGTQGLTKNGPGLLVLGPPAGYSGPTTNNAGVLALQGSLNTWSNAPLAINAGVVDSGATLFLNVDQGPMVGSTNVTGAGTLRLTSAANGTNSPDLYFGQDHNGVLFFGAQIDAGILDLGPVQRYIYARTGHNSVAKYRGWEDARINAGIMGAGGITYLAQNNIGGATPMECPLVLGGNNRFTGPLEIQRGSVYLLNSGALAGGNALLLDPAAGNNARLFLYGNNTTVANLSSGGLGSALIANGNVNNNVASVPPATLTVEETTNTTFGGVLVDTRAEYDDGTNTTGPLSLVKAGPGTLTLGGASTYSGTTTVSAGVLVVDGSLGASSTVTVAVGAALEGSGTVAGPVVVNGGIAGGAGTVGALATGPETWNPGGALLFTVTNTAAAGGSLLNIKGGLVIAATAASPFVINVVSQTAAGVAGPISGFNPAASQTWPLVATTTGITGFSTNVFLISTNGLANAVAGSFSVAANGNLLQLVYSGRGVPTPAPSGIVAWWPGNGSAIDVVGGNNGTLTNAETYAPGEVGQAFSGSTNHAGVFIGNPASLQLQNLTIEAWIQRASTSVVSSDPTANGGAAGIFYFGAGGYGMGIHQANGAISLTQIDSNDVNDGGYGACVTDLNWHHVAVTKSGSTVTFYVDGREYPPVTGYNATFVFTTPAAIGVRGDLINGNNNDSFAGHIDELAIYNRALSAGEILSIYNAGAAGKSYTPPAAAALTLTRGHPSLQLSWPAGGTSTLQQNTNLAMAGGWVAGAYSIITTNGTNVVTFTVPAAGNLFFRLLTP